MSLVIHEAYSFDSQELELFWWDDFLGDQIADEWRVTGTGVWAVIDQQTGGVARLVVDNTEWGSIDWGVTFRTLHVSKKVCIEYRLKWGTIANLAGNFGLYCDVNNRIRFIESGARWDIACMDGGASTTENSGIAPDTSYHRFRIECELVGGSHVHFYIDSPTECAGSPITTNVPDDAGDYFTPHFYVQSSAAGIEVDFDYIGVRQLI